MEKLFSSLKIGYTVYECGVFQNLQTVIGSVIKPKKVTQLLTVTPLNCHQF